MRRWIVIGLLVASLVMAMPVMAAKPATNLAGAQKVAWHLSGAVMPVPPYGSLDVPGSDTASKLIVNQPNGEVAAGLTGPMNGLNPDTEYTVYVSKGYAPFTPINVVGTYTWLVLGTYSHDLVIDVQNPDGTFSGYGGYPSGSSPYTSEGQTTETITGFVTGNQVTFTTTYAGPYNPGYTATAVGTIAPDGSMSGIVPWEWHTTSGAAAPASGSTGWPGLLLGAVQPFTFTTDEFGSGSWHVNLLRDDFPAPGAYPVSVWINGGGLTVLISDTFTVTI
jgi:hypothetical protein